MTQPDHRECVALSATPWTKDEVVASRFAKEGLDDKGFVNEGNITINELRKCAECRSNLI